MVTNNLDDHYCIARLIPEATNVTSKSTSEEGPSLRLMTAGQLLEMRNAAKAHQRGQVVIDAQFVRGTAPLDLAGGKGFRSTQR